MPHIRKQMISFFLTTKCNLRCIYCYNSKERANNEERTLSFEIAKAGIDYFFSINKSRHIRFYGPGEPTQAFKLLKQITEYARLKTIELVTTEIQTNGVFGHKVREWMLDNLNIIWISFDGEPEVQNSNRPLPGNRDSAPIIEDNVKWFCANKDSRNLMVGARVTITEKNISRQKELVDYFRSLGISYIWTDPMFPSVEKIPVCHDVKRYSEYSFDMDLYIDNYINAYKYAKQKGIFYGSILTCNFDGETNRHCRACTPVPHLTPDGYVSACDMVTFGADAHHMDCFVYGKWNKDTHSFTFDDQKIYQLQQRKTENMQHCKRCPIKLHCGGYCLGEVANETGNMYGQKPAVCSAIQKLYNSIGPSDPYDYLHP